ncbi:MAG: disulfide bond formation protein B [Proteobacteria bacterium]|nr:disulfide bond formation protein B [Pseudomonadota bacterium]
MLRWRLGHLALSLFCASTIAFAIYLERTQFLSPCPLCIFQRVAFITFGLLSLCSAAIPLPKASRFWPIVLTIVGLAGAGVAARHVAIQYFIDPSQLPSCGPGLNYLMETQPWLQVFKGVLTGHGECGVIDWSLFGMSLPVLALLGFSGLIAGTWGIRFWQAKA